MRQRISPLAILLLSILLIAAFTLTLFNLNVALPRSEWVQALWQHKGNAIVDAVDGKRVSLGGYLQLHNDHTFSAFVHQNSPATAERYQTLVAQYRLPVFAGRVTGNLTGSEASAPTADRFSGGVVYEYRFN